MTETTISGPTAAAPAPLFERALRNPDGSYIPDVILNHHRPEDIGDLTNQDVPEDDGGSGFFGADGLTFGDVLDVINPLQHIPVVSTIYRAITGDEISPGARVAGGALFGGPVGFAVATVNAMVEASTGEDIGETVLSAFIGDETDDPGEAIASAKNPVVAAADADPVAIGTGTAPVSLLPPRPASPARLSVESMRTR